LYFRKPTAEPVTEDKVQLAIFLIFAVYMFYSTCIFCHGS